MKKLNPVFFIVTVGTLFFTIINAACTVKYHNADTIKGLASVNVTIPAMPVTSSEQLLASGSCNYNIDSFMLIQSGIGVSNINSLKITSCAIIITNADSLNNASCFSTCKAFYATSSHTDPGYFYQPDIQDIYSNTLILPTPNPADIKDYFYDKSKSAYSKTLDFNYSINGQLRHPITHPMNCVIQLTFEILSSNSGTTKPESPLDFQGHF